MATDLDRDDFLPPGGPVQNLDGGNLITSTTVTPTKMICHIVSTAAITTIVPPRSGLFHGPIYLIADSLISWTSSGNIAAPPGTTLTVTAGHAYGFIYTPVDNKWHPIGGG